MARHKSENGWGVKRVKRGGVTDYVFPATAGSVLVIEVRRGVPHADQDRSQFKEWAARDSVAATG